ncbi:MAG TPA: NYN domain-containing protein [Clostridia bacterium]|nr:NYN domain-containing protein [Clostridia bacterium]
MRTYVYIDAFNLYHGRLEDTPHRWLDLFKFATEIAPRQNVVEHVHLFSGVVTQSPPNDPFRAARQATYFRALETLPQLTIHKTRFVTHAKRRRLVDPPPDGPSHVQVYITEEKEADVRLAAQIVADGFMGLYDAAIIVSNDSDLRGPVEIVRNRVKRPVGVSNPHAGKFPDMVPGDFRCRPITDALLQRSQFPQTIQDARGTFGKPAAW